MPFFTDTHAHIYSKQFKADQDQMLERCFEQGVRTILMPNIDHESIEPMLDLEQRYPANCLPMMGLHPCSVDQHFEKALYEVENWLSKRHFWAVGEMGLDLYWDKSFFEQQQEAFEIQANWAKKYHLPLVIHSREAMEEVITLLEKLKDERLFGVLHCFTGTVEQAKRLIELGFKLGIGGVVTYKNSGLDKVLEQIDLEHLILETDSPYLAPNPHRGKRNESSYIPIIAQKIADIKQVGLEKIAEITSQTAKSLFSVT